MAGSTALRRITRDIKKIASFMATGTDLGGSGRGDGVAAVLAFKVSQTAMWTDIICEFSRGLIATQGTFHLFFLFHLISLPFFAKISLLSNHSLATVGTFLLEAWDSQLVNLFLTAIWANAVSSRPCCKSSATPSASCSASAPAGYLPSSSWSISSGHLHTLLVCA